MTGLITVLGFGTELLILISMRGFPCCHILSCEMVACKSGRTTGDSRVNGMIESNFHHDENNAFFVLTNLGQWGRKPSYTHALKLHVTHDTYTRKRYKEYNQI